MSFFDFLEKSLFNPSRTQRSIDPKLSDCGSNFVRIRIRLNNLQEDDNITSDMDLRRCEDESSKEGLVKISSEIFRYRFLSCFEQTPDPNLRGRIIITDKQSLSMFRRAMDWLTIKRFGVSCIFTFQDKVSNGLTKNLQVIYLINTTHISDSEFKQQIADVRRRECRSCCIFLTYITDPFHVETTNRLALLQKIITMKSLSSPWIVGAFHGFDPWIGLIDSQANLSYLKQYISQPSSSQDTLTNRTICCRLAFRLVNVFEQMNQFPTVRYMKTWHPHNHLIGQLFVKGLNGLKEKRRKSGETMDYQQDFLLLIIDRSVDLLTPILHATYYHAFVEQELETSFPHSSDRLDSKLRNVHINDIKDRLASLSRELKANHYNMSIKQQEITMDFVRSHLEISQRLMAKMNDDYRQLLLLEQNVVDTLNQRLDKSQSKGVKLPKSRFSDTVHSQFGTKIDSDMNPSDLHRLVIARSLLTRSFVGAAYLRKLLGKKKFTYKDSSIISKYSKLMINLFDLSETLSFRFPVLSHLIDQVYSGLLAEDKFPFVEAKMKTAAPRKKLCIFVLGGLSYNEIQYSGVELNRDVVLISDNLLTSKNILSSLYPDEA
ncbi:syntaxin-binding protein 1 [Tetranychus urticae]|uniref:Uncharacterized protein n=1 Tax=Tetranychus urticae TaxID=32264 RepID=T1K7H2_TETUR|nr:syntaxin-binding protein 1 [Tetranychus urticae]